MNLLPARLSAFRVFGLLALLPLIGHAEDTPESLMQRSRAVLAQLEGEVRLSGLRPPVKVMRDRWGIAHIEAENTHDVFSAQECVIAPETVAPD